jgi:hypothetical protein
MLKWNYISYYSVLLITVFVPYPWVRVLFFLETNVYVCYIYSTTCRWILLKVKHVQNKINFALSFCLFFANRNETLTKYSLTLTQTDKSILHKHCNRNGMVNRSEQFRSSLPELTVRPEVAIQFHATERALRNCKLRNVISYNILEPVTSIKSS